MRTFNHPPRDWGCSTACPIRGIGRLAATALVWAGLATTATAQVGGRAIGREDLGPPPIEVPLPLPAAETPGTVAGFAPRFAPVATARPTRAAADLIQSAGGPTANLEVRVGQGRFLTLRERYVVPGKPAPFLAVGDPSVADFFQVDDTHLRLIGKRIGTTDLSITMPSGQTYEYEVQVVADLDLLSSQLKQMFPEASLRLAQVREKLVVEGQARDAAQVGRIISTLEAAIRSVQQVQITGQVEDTRSTGRVAGADPTAAPAATPGNPNAGSNPVGPAPPAQNTAPIGGGGGFYGGVEGPGIGGGSIGPTSPGGIAANRIATDQSQVINLIRVPTSQQVLLKVRVAELNRTAFRQIGADFLAESSGLKSLIGTQIAGNGLANGILGANAFPSPTINITPATQFSPAIRKVTISPNAAALGLGSAATAYGTFGQGAFNTVLTALRRNNLLKVLAEPNVLALNGHQAHFLAGGEFPVPSFSGVGSGAAAGGGTSSTQFKEFGVRLSFLPIILDNDVIRLTIDPEVSTVDFSVATTLVPGGSPVPGLNKRSQHTTVELKAGDTLAIGGLLQLTLDGQTQRLPGLGDLPLIGEFFSNTSSERIEKELVITVTPYLVEPMAPGQVPPGPGDEVQGPNDLEFFLLNRIEGRTGVDNRATTRYDDPFHLIRRQILEKKYLIGPAGYSR